MKQNISAEELEQALKKASAMNNDAELDLNDLESVNGGWSTGDRGDMITIDLTEEEYYFLNSVLGLSMAKSIIDQYGLGDIQIERHMVVPRDKGETLRNLLSTFMGIPT